MRSFNLSAKAEGRIVPNLSDRAIDKAMKAACTKAGFEWKQNYLRHSFCTYAVALKDYGWAAKMAGSSEGILKKNYVGVTRKADAECYFNIRLTTLTNIVPMTAAA